MSTNYGFLPTKDFANPDKVTYADVSPAAADGAGETICLYKYWEQLVSAPTRPRDQGKGSDCVGQSTARGIDIVTAVAIMGLGLPIKFVAMASATSIYGGSRVEVGKRKYRMNLRNAGSHVPYAAEFCADIGCLYMMKYPSIDLSTHSWAVSKAWGNEGMPDELEAEAHAYGMLTGYVPINSYAEYRGAIKNGNPVVFGSSFGFKGQKNRDADGFLEPNGTWMHAMVGTAVDDSPRRPGGCIENSWGADWVGGPKHLDQPDGSFWVDADVIEDMARKGEAVALLGVNGHAKNNLQYVLI